MANEYHQDLVDEILAFCEREDLSKTEFGKQAIADPGFVHQLLAGRQCFPKTVRRVRDFMSKSRAA